MNRCEQFKKRDNSHKCNKITSEGLYKYRPLWLSNLVSCNNKETSLDQTDLTDLGITANTETIASINTDNLSF